MDNGAPTREQILQIWSKYSDKAEDPADLTPLNSPELANDAELRQAEKQFDDWYRTASEKAAKDSPEASLEVQFLASTFYIDAGFSGADYLDEVANDWLMQDEQTAEENGWSSLAAKIKAKRSELNQRIGRSENLD